MKMNKELTAEDRKLFEDEPKGIGKWALEIIDAQARELTAANSQVDLYADRLETLRNTVPDGWVAVDPIVFERYKHRCWDLESQCRALAEERAGLRSELDHEKRLTAEHYKTIRAHQTQAEKHQDETVALRAELKSERDRRVEHRQMNQSLNEQVDGLLKTKRYYEINQSTLQGLTEARALLARVDRMLSELRDKTYDTDMNPIPGWDQAMELGQMIDGFRAELSDGGVLAWESSRAPKTPRPKCTCGDDYVAVMAAHDIGCPVVSTRVKLPVTTTIHGKMPESYGHESSCTHYIKPSSAKVVCDEREALAARLDETQRLLAKCKIVALDTCIHEDELRSYIIGFVESYPESPRIAAENAVISTCLRMQPGDDYIPEDPDDPAEVAEDCYIYTGDQYAIAKSVMALKKVIYGH